MSDIERLLAAYGHKPVKYDFVLKELLPIVKELKAASDASVAALERQIVALEARFAALEQKPSGVKYCGTFRGDGQAYSEGALVTRSGSLWVAERATTDIPGQPDSGWRMIVKSGHAA